MTNKQKRKKAKHEKNIQAEKEYKQAAWESGKLIKENNPDYYFKPDYSVELGRRLIEKLEKGHSDPEHFLVIFRAFKGKIQELILKWSPWQPKDDNYILLKELLEIYWDQTLLLGDTKTLYDRFRNNN